MQVVEQLTVEFGLIKDYPETTINYNGDDDSGVTIIVDTFGPASNVRISRANGGEYVLIDSTKLTQITGHDIQEYDHIEINTRKGQKSAVLMRGGTEHNILHAIVSSKNWLRIERGSNRFTFAATSGASNIRVHLKYTERVNGV